MFMSTTLIFPPNVSLSTARTKDVNLHHNYKLLQFAYRFHTNLCLSCFRLIHKIHLFAFCELQSNEIFHDYYFYGNVSFFSAHCTWHTRSLFCGEKIILFLFFFSEIICLNVTKTIIFKCGAAAFAMHTCHSRVLDKCIYFAVLFHFHVLQSLFTSF